MRILLALIAALFPRRVVFGANETAPETDAVHVANESKKDGDWVLLSPYGDWPNPQGLQRFVKADAVNMVNEFKALLNTPARLIGLPWYVGHPDHPAFKDRYRDTRAYGRIKDLDARDDGLFANVKWSPAGKELIESEAFHGHSVNWAMRKDGSAWRPFRLKSVGFTNEPNIPVNPITAANETSTLMEKSKLIKVLGLADNATDEQIESSIVDLKTKHAANETKLDELTGQVTSLTTEKTTLSGRVTTLETSFANERKARAGILLDQAISAGRVTKAERAQWEADFANEFDGTATKLASLKPRLNTASRTGNVGQRNTEQRSATEKSTQIREAVNERMEKHKETYAVAWQTVKRQKPELFLEQEAVNAGE